MKVSIYRRYRGAWFSWEKQPQYFCVSISHPRKHAWWAIMIYLYF